MLWLLAATAWADSCSCDRWSDAWAWSDGGSCACTDVVTRVAATLDTGSPIVCSATGLQGAPHEGADCVYVGTCEVTDCCDELVADCPGEASAGCGCGTAAPGAGTALLALSVALVGRRRTDRR
ncbi:MAG: hypothetical protein R3F59_13605 [Myxococcota bacterium]